MSDADFPQSLNKQHPPVEPELIEWANSHLPGTLQISSQGSVCGALELSRIAESIKRVRGHITPDSAFPHGPNDDTLEGLFNLFDFWLDNDVKMGMISINDVRQGKRDKIVQLLKVLRAWEKRHAVLRSTGKISMRTGSFVAWRDVFGTKDCAIAIDPSATHNVQNHGCMDHIVM
jgi:hypothetical protein